MTVSLILAAAMAWQAGSQQFDLICTGTLESSSTASTTPTATQVSDRAAVDLERGLWCWLECSVVNAIHSRNAAELVLSNKDETGGSAYLRVDRITGAYTNDVRLNMEGGYVIKLNTTGHCERAPYTPIPRAAF
ncbi:hypothetical protein [Brevundimonas sp.]|uniref:hypothetical protein n=1 Tax=Brevundimonas sp. TaxID=1871086 RepID=UPI0028A2267B|nr:hypothetical protein [Brevundimonas sp.]